MLESTLENLDGVDDALKPFYTEKDGKFTLQVKGMQTDDEVAGLKTALLKERENVAEYSKLGSAGDIAQKINDLKSKALSGGGKDADHEALIAQLNEKHAGELAERDGTIGEMRSSRVSAELKAELSKAGVIAEGVDLLATFAQSRVKFNDDGSLKIVASDGSTPAIGDGPHGGATLANLAKELAGTIPHLVKDDGKGGGGKRSHEGGKPAEANPWAQGSINLTKQAEILRNNPTLAQELKAAAVNKKE